MVEVMIICETGGLDRWQCVGISREFAEIEYKLALRHFPRPLYRVIVTRKR